MTADDRTPVTVVTGYLGAGKTTLINRLLANTRDRRLAVIVNEFGDIGIDGDLIETADEELIQLSSGCICCVVRGDLIRTMRRLLKRDQKLDGVVIETTGLANPSPVIQTFAADQVLAGLSRLDAVVTVVDAVSGAARLADSPDAADQAALASLIVLNKATGAPDPEGLTRQLRALNPHAQIFPTDRGAVDAAVLLGTNGFDLDRVAEQLDDHDRDHTHDHDHIAANGITSLSLTTDTPLDPEATEAWISELLTLHGADILRMKGVLALDGEDRRVIVQSVNMLYEGDYGHLWGTAPRLSRLVFIGRNLDTTGLKDGFAACQKT